MADLEYRQDDAEAKLALKCGKKKGNGKKS
jgi:hypothetical protein